MTEIEDLYNQLYGMYPNKQDNEKAFLKAYGELINDDTKEKIGKKGLPKKMFFNPDVMSAESKDLLVKCNYNLFGVKAHVLNSLSGSKTSIMFYWGDDLLTSREPTYKSTYERDFNSFDDFKGLPYYNL